MGLISQLVEIGRLKVLFFEKLAIWRSAVPLICDANVEVRVYVDADPPFRPEHLAIATPSG